MIELLKIKLNMRIDILLLKIVISILTFKF